LLIPTFMVTILISIHIIFFNLILLSLVSIDFYCGSVLVAL
jgi:hypothetical protein